MFQKLRRKLASWLVGEQTLLFVSKKDGKALTEFRFADIDDATLGALYRRDLAIVGRYSIKEAEKDHRQFDAVMRTSAVLYLASVADRFNSKDSNFIVDGTLDGGRTSGKWGVHVERLPDDYEMGKGVEMTEEPDGRITKISLTYDNPGYKDWLAERRAKRVEDAQHPEADWVRSNAEQGD